jgi:hypothetical protein
MRLAAVVAALAVIADQGSPNKPKPSVAQPDAASLRDSVTIAWVLPRDDIQRGQTLDAWLVAHNGATHAGSVTITLLTAAGASAWLRNAGETCAGSIAAKRDSATFSLGRDSVVSVCAVGTEEVTTHLVASLTQKHGTRVVQIIAVSDPLHIASPYAPGPMLTAVLTAMLGFAGGVATTLLTKWFESMSERRKHVSEIRATISTLLAPELMQCRNSLDDFLHDPNAEPPILPAAAYNMLLGDAGIMSYLSAGDRRQYFAAIAETYDMMSTYKNAVNQGDRVQARALAQPIIARLSKIVPHP